MEPKPRRREISNCCITAPAILWLLTFLVIPLLMIACVSFLTRGDYGDTRLPFTLENYKRLFGFGLLGFDSLYPVILFRSVVLGLATALLCIVAGLPLSFFIAQLPGRFKNFALLLVVIPFWTNLLIRTYAWQILLAPGSWLAKVLEVVGVATTGQALYPSTFAVIIGMVCDFLPFLVLPLYSSVEKIDWTIAEAAADLGANRFQVFRHAVMPQILPGLLAGGILVLLPAIGQFVIPDLLGGARTAMIGNVIQQQFGQSRDWPFGSALAFSALLFVLIVLSLYRRFIRQHAEGDLL